MTATAISIFSAFLIGGSGLALLVGLVFLQISLSKKDNRWLGLLLPTLCLMFSLIAVLSVPAYTSGELTLQKLAPDGTVIESHIEQDPQPIADTGSVAVQIVVVFLIYNIPTVVLVGIYLSCRQKYKKIHGIEKMNIQELE